MLLTFGTFKTCYGMLGVANQTSVHALTQHCYANLAKRVQQHVTPTNELI